MASGPETRLVNHMRKDGMALYGERLVIIKYHGSAFSEAGVSDLLCCLDGHFIACEVKAPESYGNNVERALDEGPTLKQKAFLRRVGMAGGTFAVVATREQFLDVLAAADAMNREWCVSCHDYKDGRISAPCFRHPTNEPRSV